MSHEKLPATQPAVRTGREWSWLPPAGGEPAAGGGRLDTPEQVAGALARCLTFLQWQLLARDGNLYLSAVDPVIRGLPDPDAAWTALLSVLPALSAGLPPVTSVTDLRRNDDAGWRRCCCPPKPTPCWTGPRPPPTGWAPRCPPTRHRSGCWTNGSHRPPCAPPAHRQPATCRPSPRWPRPPWTPSATRRPVAAVPRRRPPLAAPPPLRRAAPGRVGVTLGTPGRDTLHHLSVHPDAVAALLLHAEMAGRPVRLTVPAGTLDAARPLADRLQHLLGQPVHLTETPHHKPHHPATPTAPTPPPPPSLHTPTNKPGRTLHRATAARTA